MDYKETKKLWKKEWWNTRQYGKSTNSIQHIEQSEYIAKKCVQLGLNINTMCELGIGNGRNINCFSKFYDNIQCYGNDIYPKITDIIKKYNPNILSFTKLYVCDALTFMKNFTREIDCILTHGFLMHIPEDTINDLLQMIFDKSKIFVFFEAYVNNNKPNQKDYRFERDYLNYIPNNFCVYTEQIKDQCLYLGTKK